MNRHFSIYLFLLLGFLANSSIGFAQSATLKINDESTDEPCSFATVVVFDLQGNYIKGASANEAGELILEISQRRKIEITYVGYVKYIGFISPGDNIDIQLKQDLLELETVVVTGQYNPKPIDKSIYQIDLISSRQMEERGVNNLAEALSNETNVRLSVDPALGTSLQLQGMGGENVKFLLDGVPIIGRLDGNIDLTQINMDNVDHIEIVKGPMSVVYGTNALAGVVNIITKVNTRNSEILKLGSYIGSEGAYNFSISGSLIRKRNTFSIYGARNMFQGIDLNDSTRYMDFKPKLQYNTGFDYTFRKSDFKLRYRITYFDEEIRHYGNVQGISATDQYFNTNRLVNSLQLNDKFGESFFFEAVGAYSIYNRDTQNYRKDLTDFEQNEVGTPSETSFTNIMLRTSVLWAKPDAKISTQFGLDLNYDDARGDKISTDDPSMGDYAAFVSAQWDFLPSATLQPGLRFIYNTKYQAPIIPSINLQWEFFNNFNFRASYALGFRAPSIKELYLDFVDSNHDLHGNEDLTAETNNSFNSSISYKIGKRKFQLKLEPNFFFNSGKNIITIVAVDPGSNEYQSTNIGKRKTIGGEFNVSFLLYPGLTITPGFGRTGITWLMDPESNDFPDYTFYNNLIFNAKYNFQKQKLIIGAYYKYYGSTPRLVFDDTDNNPDTDPVPVTINRDPYGDLEATVTKLFWKNKVTVVIGGKNLLNVKYVGYDNGDLTNNPTAFGRYFFLKVNLKFSK